MEDFLQTIGALNDETRLKLLRFIKMHETVCVCELEQSFGMVQSRISRHLKILKDAGFLYVKRDGRWAYYAIRSPMDKFRQDILTEIVYLEIELPSLKRQCDTSNQEKKDGQNTNRTF